MEYAESFADERLAQLEAPFLQQARTLSRYEKRVLRGALAQGLSSQAVFVNYRDLLFRGEKLSVVGPRLVWAAENLYRRTVGLDHGVSVRWLLYVGGGSLDEALMVRFSPAFRYVWRNSPRFQNLIRSGESARASAGSDLSGTFDSRLQPALF